MTRDDDHSNADNAFAHEFGTGRPGKERRQEPTLGRFDEDEAYEEPDRDADYTPGYHPDEADPEDDFDDDYADEDDPDLFQAEAADTSYDADPHDEDEQDTWLENEDYPEEEEEHGQNWPLSLVAVAVVALVLLAAGGYGVMQQRAATEEELRELRAELATTSKPRDGATGLAAQGELQLAYDKLVTEADALRLENKTLTDTVAGLETQLGSQQQAKSTATAAVAVAAQAKPTPAGPAQAEPVNGTTAKAAAKPIQPVTKPSTAPAPAAAAKPTEAKPAVAGAAGPWFVNFGSYATRNMANSWAARLKPGAGKVTIMPNTSNGRTLYRLRIVGLADSASAKQVARKLETELRVAELWVGRE